MNTLIIDFRVSNFKKDLNNSDSSFPVCFFQYDNCKLLQCSHSKRKKKKKAKTWNLRLYSFLSKLKEQPLLQFLCDTGLRQSGKMTNIPQHNNSTPLCLEDKTKSSLTERIFFLQYADKLLLQRESKILHRGAKLIEFQVRNPADLLLNKKALD